MKQKNLIIFIDSFPYYILHTTNFLSQFPIQYKVTPGFGYSINLQAEIFSGKKPDELGYFCEWGYNPEKVQFSLWEKFCHVLNPVKKMYSLDRLMHRSLGKIIKKNIGNIPFAYLPLMKRVSADVFEEDFQKVCLFSNFSKIIKLISFYRYNYLPIGKRDEKVFNETLISIKNDQNVVCTFMDLDGLAHRFGLNANQYEKRKEELDSWIAILSKEFFKQNPDGTVVVVSDHGMTTVRDGVFIDFERIFGKPSKETYYYFLDATILRVWTFDKLIMKEIENFLKESIYGRILTDEERKSFGITNKLFGDIIYQLDEGLMFNPSFWGKGLSKSMHGYHPKLDSQKGIFLILQGTQRSQDSLMQCSEIRTTEIYQKLCRLFIERS